ncbi:viral A-type inclusion protein [Reticulomyxa filosa]|uniref:Viral A-type inclusion protein n=1 Tax=Reticulomyxa filosa TaxID=46433 RepID=X6NYV6_RETFI|nr:viral A-type inclusion protein [Reticulomyxa filosa]|eukprot:ETO31166.1 viral A-type inclusion protein [Reticulomyxa filosa]
MKSSVIFTTQLELQVDELINSNKDVDEKIERLTVKNKKVKSDLQKGANGQHEQMQETSSQIASLGENAEKIKDTINTFQQQTNNQISELRSKMNEGESSIDLKNDIQKLRVSIENIEKSSVFSSLREVGLDTHMNICVDNF